MGDKWDRRKSPKTPSDFAPAPGKHPAARTIPEFKHTKPTWSLSILDRDGPFAWSRDYLDHDRLGQILKRLRNFESMTWGEILYAGRYRNHQVDVSGICKAARDRLEEIGQSDIDKLVSLGLDQIGRVWGILHDTSVLRLLWWDPDHQVWPTAPRNT